MKGFIHIDKRTIISKKNPGGRVRYYVFATVDGAKKSEGSFNYLKDARARKRALEWEIADGTYGQQKRAEPLFCEYYQEWWQGKSLSLKPAAQRAYQGSFDRYILPYFGKMRINAISPQNVQRFIGTLKGLSPGYVKTIYSHLRAMMNTAFDHDIIAKSPCRRIDLPRPKAMDIQYLEPSEVWSLLDTMGWPYKALFGVLALTGMRVGEGLALQMKHVDLEKKEIRIERAWDINTREFHEPKTRAGIRRVDIMDPLTEILRQYFVCYPVAGRDSLLFPSITEATQPVSYNSIFGVFKRSLKKAELPDVTIHSLRHTYASIMLSVGASVNTLARHLGHSSPQITFRIYSHEISENLGDALDRASKLITAARATKVGEPSEPRHT